MTRRNMIPYAFFVAATVVTLTVVYRGRSERTPQTDDRQQAAASPVPEEVIPSTTTAIEEDVASTSVAGSGGKQKRDSILDLIDEGALYSQSLSPRELATAITAYSVERDRWVRLRTLSAKYKTTMRRIVANKFLDNWSQPSQTGTLDVVATPGEEQRKPVQLQVHLHNENRGWHFAREDLRGNQEVLSWADNEDSPVEGAKEIETSYRMFPIDGMMRPLILMVNSYRDDLWGMSPFTKEQFFTGWGTPRRRSSEEETAGRFGGDPHYLFHIPAPGAAGVEFWFSSETGQLTDIDRVLAREDATISHHYGDYIVQGDTQFPRKHTVLYSRGSGDQQEGWEYTVELTDVKLNTKLTAAFAPPRGQPQRGNE